MKKIILCADGTWNTPPGADSAGGTNVWKLYCSLPDSPTQLKFYDSGVGTAGGLWDRLTGGALGEGLFQKVQDCYAFLSHVYDPGDQVFSFGFSRGAYTARSVAGMIAAFGVPSRNLSNSTTPEIFAAYRERDKTRRAEMKKRLTDSYGLEPVRIAMVGVWDTVGSLGVPGTLFQAFNSDKYGFLDTTLSDCVDFAYHAISIDERRASFKPTLWTNPDGSYRRNDARVEQVWFAGAHCDVGGSYAESQLADITLAWMMRKGKQHGLELLPEMADKYFNLPPSFAIGPAHDEWKLLKWGPYRHREVPAQAYLASSVFQRARDANPPYRPVNLTFVNDTLTGYQRCEVLPYTEPVWPAPAAGENVVAV